MNKISKKILESYQKKSPLYSKFALAVRSLLENMLEREDYKHHITYRLKDMQSLERKIKRKNSAFEKYKKLEDIKDIAGVRIIFYTENDRRRFMRKLDAEFKGSLQIEKASKISGYRAIHAIFSFGKERLKLSEYEAFKGLECEIQLCLILEHAWAEIEHDILYKENWGFRELDKVNYIFMKEKMGNIMKNYINKASEEFERIILRSKKLKRGQKL